MSSRTRYQPASPRWRGLDCGRLCGVRPAPYLVGPVAARNECHALARFRGCANKSSDLRLPGFDRRLDRSMGDGVERGAPSSLRRSFERQPGPNCGHVVPAVLTSVCGIGARVPHQAHLLCRLMVSPVCAGCGPRRRPQCRGLVLQMGNAGPGLVPPRRSSPPFARPAGSADPRKGNSAYPAFRPAVVGDNSRKSVTRA